MQIWSTVYLTEEASADWATCTLEVGEWRRVTDMYEGAKRLFARIEFAGHEVYLALGSPVQPVGLGAGPNMFLPAWALAMLGADGAGEPVSVDWLSEEAFPEATRVVLRPHDSAFYHADAKEELERGLTRLGLVRCGDVISIPMEKLGGYVVTFDVVATEPANVVLAEGDEVAMEFEEALDAAAARAAAPRPPTPIPAEPEILSAGMEQMIPMPAVAPEPVGRRLGGESGPRLMPDGTRWNPWRHGAWNGPPGT